MTEIQKLQFDMLVKLDEVCRRHKLRYYLAYGTCIGAVRHKGFIPWDHDVDVLMPINDVKKLEKLQKEFGSCYFVRSYRTDKGYKGINASICDKNHPCVLKRYGKVIEKTYVSMDVYPFYSCPPTKLGLIRRVLGSHIYKILVGGIPKNHGDIVKILAKIILAFHPKSKRERDIKRYERLLDYRGESTEIADYFGQDVTALHVITYKQEWFAKPQEMEFEGHLFFGPTDYDKYLTKRYGDYMTPTSPKEQEEEIVVELA